MKILGFLLVFGFSDFASATTACASFNTQTRIAREAVKTLIGLAEVPPVVTYYCGVESHENGEMVVNVQPHFENSKDWYKVTVRNSDCRVLNVVLFAEQLAK